jgi:hypothetical protein
MPGVKRFVPKPIWLGLKSSKRVLLRSLRRSFELCGLNVARRADYYSPLPTESQLLKNLHRWNKPSALTGISIELSQLRDNFERLTENRLQEFLALPSYEQNIELGFGPGYPHLDAFTLYALLREHKPARYLEVGSGLSTYYSSLAATQNAREGRSLLIECIEPYPYPTLSTIPSIKLIQDEVQNVPISTFQQLQDGDVLFIDSSHAVRIDSDVPYLFLEVLPALNPGVFVHIHDVPFPFNIPFPANQWVLGKEDYSPYWPIYWNEAMFVQSFLAFNSAFEVILSTPYIRYFEEAFLQKSVPFYKTIAQEPNTFSSLWIRRKPGA